MTRETEFALTLNLPCSAVATELDGFDPIHSYKGFDLFIEWEITDATRRNYLVRTPLGRIIQCDWTPFHSLSAADFARWVDLGCPGRVTCGPLRSEHLDQLSLTRKAA